ncbi:hypothetical protein SAMN05216207_103527 [Pseudonocardia ammonioxydans]|uniref:Uncharacterized protein n=1 Tax=Pseudonocardia ammonioxydans TaxID=260086 RepID=A0A1I5F5V9_PSUAM|nr:hypothetical protein SAMN05216207_103527 [Pseudonocardia ammonioxydans]
MHPRSGNGTTTYGDGSAVEEKSVTPSPSASSRHFPQTLVAMDPPTLPAANLTPAPAEFRQFPAPQRSEPGHPQLRNRLRRILLFWRRGA